MTLYIYWVGWTYPARNSFYRSKSLKKTLVVLGLYLDRSDRSVPAGQATVPRLVRPLDQTGQTGWCQFWLSTDSGGLQSSALELQQNMLVHKQVHSPPLPIRCHR